MTIYDNYTIKYYTYGQYSIYYISRPGIDGYHDLGIFQLLGYPLFIAGFFLGDDYRDYMIKWHDVYYSDF